VECHQDRRRWGSRELTGIVDYSREGPSHGPLVGPGPGKVWHRAWELAGQARKRLPCGSANRRLDPLHVFCWASVYFFAITWQLSASTASHLQTYWDL